MGDDVSFLTHLMKDENDSYGAIEAIKYLSSANQLKLPVLSYETKMLEETLVII